MTKAVGFDLDLDVLVVVCCFVCMYCWARREAGRSRPPPGRYR